MEDPFEEIIQEFLEKMDEVKAPVGAYIQGLRYAKNQIDLAIEATGVGENVDDDK